MVPNKLSMVDLGGIDIVESQGVEIPGIYNKLVESILQCRYQVIYNWKFDGILIPPTYVEMEIDDSEVKINNYVSVSNTDVVYIHSLEITIPPVINELSVTENGEYHVPEGVDGYDPVIVNIPPYVPVISSLSITENGTYVAPEGVDGYSPVAVNIPARKSAILPLSLITAEDILFEVGFRQFDLVNDTEDTIIHPNISLGGEYNFISLISQQALGFDLGDSNKSVTIYGIVRANNSSGDNMLLSCWYGSSTGNDPNFYTRANDLRTSVWGSTDSSTGKSSRVFNAIAMSINNTSKKVRFFVNGAFDNEKSFYNSGRVAAINGNVNYQGEGVSNSSEGSFMYFAVVDGVETDEEIISNLQTLIEHFNLEV